MNQPDSEITVVVTSPQAGALERPLRGAWPGWLASLGVHGSVLAALTTVGAPQLDSAPTIHGQRVVSTVELTGSLFSRPNTVEQPVELVDEVEIRPESVRIGSHHVVPAEDMPRVEVALEVLLASQAIEQVAARDPSPSVEPPPEELHQELAELATPTPAPPTAESSSEAAPNSDAPSDAAPSSQPQMAGLDDSAPPRLLNNQPPIYPAQARAERRQGTVILRLEVSDSGNVSDVAVLISSGHTILDAAAVRAVRAWRFEPARATGRAVTWTGRLPVRFLLD